MNARDPMTVVREFLVGELGARAADLAPDQDLLAEGMLDSMAVVRLTLFLEQTFQIRIPPEDVIPDFFQTLRAIGEYVTRRREPA